MKVSVKLEYAARVMVHLARMPAGGGLAHIGPLAEAEGVPPNYLVQILAELRGAGLIVSRRGKQGGYALARPAERISLLEIAEAVEGELMSFPEISPGACGAVVRGAFDELRGDLREKAASIRLDRLVPAPQDSMYFI